MSGRRGAQARAVGHWRPSMQRGPQQHLSVFFNAVQAARVGDACGKLKIARGGRGKLA